MVEITALGIIGGFIIGTLYQRQEMTAIVWGLLGLAVVLMYIYAHMGCKT